MEWKVGSAVVAAVACLVWFAQALESWSMAFLWVASIAATLAATTFTKASPGLLLPGLPIAFVQVIFGVWIVPPLETALGLIGTLVLALALLAFRRE